MTPALLYCAEPVASTLRKELGGLPLDLHAAFKRADVLALIEQRRPALVLAALDRAPLQLRPHLQGAELVVLGPDSPEVVRRTLRSGACDWLTTPIRPSDATRMMGAHLQRRAQRESVELMTAMTTLDAVAQKLNALEASPERDDLALLLRYGRLLLRQDARAGNVLAATSAAAELVETRHGLQISIQSDPGLPSVALSTGELGRGLVDLLGSAAGQGARRAQITAIRIRETVQIDISNDAPLAADSRFTVGTVRRLAERVGGSVELTTTSGTGFQVQITLPVS